jgi:RimJ/RimL family protein N-acetyltransferase
MQYSILPRPEHALVALRELRIEDVEAWFGILSQPLVFEHTSWDLASADALSAYVQAPPTPSSPLRFALVRCDDGTLVGTAGFHTVQPGNRTAEIAYDLDPAVWGRGIARAACESLVRWAFEHVGLVRVQATTLTSNARSQRVLEACSFQREGLLRRYRMVRGTPGDFWMYARLDR